MSAFDPNAYPARVTLAFRSEAEREHFLAQLCDGWGENEVDLGWDRTVRLRRAELVGVEMRPGGMLRTTFDHGQRLREEHPEWFQGDE